MPPTPKPPIPEDTYEALMEATFRALCKRGYSNLRVRDIDPEFEKSRQLINHYYDGKDELILALLKYLLQVYENGIELGDDADPNRLLERYVHQFLHGPDLDGFDHWELMKALEELRSQAQHQPDHQALLSETYDHITATLVGIIEDGIDEGRFRDVDAELFAHAINGIINTARTRKICLGQDEAIETAQRALDAIVLPQLRREPDAGAG